MKVFKDKDGTVLIDAGFEIYSPSLDDEVKFPPGWLNTASDEDLAIHEITVEIVPDEDLSAPVPAVPVSVTPRQARLALLAAGLLEQVEAAVEQSPQEVQIDWKYAQEIRRDNISLNTAAVALGFADRLDELFIAAARQYG